MNKETREISKQVKTNYRTGEQVYVRPVDAKCTSILKTGNRTNIITKTSFEVDSVPRHV